MRNTARTTRTIDNIGDLHLKREETFSVDGIATINGTFKFDRGSSLYFLDGNEKDGFVLTVDNDGKVGLRPGKSNAYGPRNSIQFNKNDMFAGHKEFVFNEQTRSFTLGERTPSDEGIMSFSQGSLNKATELGSFAQGKATYAGGKYSHAEGTLTTSSGDYSHAEGFSAKAKGIASHAEGEKTEADGNYSHAEGNDTKSYSIYSHAEGEKTEVKGKAGHAEGFKTKANGDYSHTEGFETLAFGTASHSQGTYTKTEGNSSFSSGLGSLERQVIAKGAGSFNHSTNDIYQGSGHGALADNSAILGGKNHNISSENTNSVIVGGESIKLSGIDYKNTVAVPNIAIFETPLNGGSDLLLTWDSKTKKVRQISQGKVADIRTKEKIRKKEDVLNAVLEINAYEYQNGNKFLPATEHGKESYGLLAQEVEKHFPHVITNDTIFNDTSYKGIKYDELVPILFQSIRELNDKIDIYRKRVDELEARLG